MQFVELSCLPCHPIGADRRAGREQAPLGCRRTLDDRPRQRFGLVSQAPAVILSIPNARIVRAGTMGGVPVTIWQVSLDPSQEMVVPVTSPGDVDNPNALDVLDRQGYAQLRPSRSRSMAPCRHNPNAWTDRFLVATVRLRVSRYGIGLRPPSRHRQLCSGTKLDERGSAGRKATDLRVC